MPAARTSATDPLRIDSVPAGPNGGRIGMTICPGKQQQDARTGVWARDLGTDLTAIHEFGATALVTLVEEHELDALQVPAATLGAEVRPLGIEWHLLPIKDFSVPDAHFEERWTYAGLRLRARLLRGERIVLHCMGGLGRTGTIAARLLVEFGLTPDEAIAAVRAARPHTIETREQEAYVRAAQRVAGATEPLPAAERALATLLGGAVGDGFGYAVEFMHLDAIRAKHGAEGLRAPVLQGGKLVVSDDTQMTLFTLEGLLAADGADPTERIRQAYLDWLDTQRGPGKRKQTGSLASDPALRVSRAPGNTCLSALQRGGTGTPHQPINDSKGCGGVMRVAPLGLLPRYSAAAAFRLAAAAAALTHGHPSGYLSAGVFAAIIRLLLDGVPLRDAAERSLPILTAWPGHEETLQAVQQALALAGQHTGGHTAALRVLGQGWVGEEALAVALYAALVAESFTDAIAIAANHDGDSDSTASLAGQLWGASHGLDGIPHEWIIALDVLAPLLHLAHGLEKHIAGYTPAGGSTMTQTTEQPSATGNDQERIAWLPLADGEPEDEDVRKLFDRAVERLGFIPNVFRVYAARPEHFKKWRAHFNEVTLGESELTVAEREMIAVVVSSENHCLYCLTAHGAGLRGALGDQVQGDRITLDYRRAGLDERTRAMLDYAVKLTVSPVECSEADIERLRSVGFSDQGVWDIIETAAMYNFTNRIASASGMLPNRAYHMHGREQQE